MATATKGRFFPVVAANLGTSQTFAGFNEVTLNISGASPWLGQLGQVFEEDGKAYRLVQFSEATVASAAGTPAYWLSRAAFTVTSDESDGESGINGIAGGFLGVQTNQYYCFIQVGGLQVTVTDGNQVPGAACIGSTTDGVFDTMLVGAATWQGQPVGIANVTDSGTVGSMYWILGNQI